MTTVPPATSVGNRFAYEPSKWNGETQSVDRRASQTEGAHGRVDCGGKGRVADLNTLGRSRRAGGVDHVGDRDSLRRASIPRRSPAWVEGEDRYSRHAVERREMTINFGRYHDERLAHSQRRSSPSVTAGSVTASGTKTAPTHSVASAATMKSTELGMRRATRSPSPTPRSRNPAPSRAASSINCRVTQLTIEIFRRGMIGIACEPVQ